MGKTTLWIIVLLIIAGLGWWYLSSRTSAPAQPAGSPQTTSQSQNPQGSASGVSASDTSNAALNADMQNIDGQMQSASSAGTSANSFSDTPVQQTE